VFFTFRCVFVGLRRLGVAYFIGWGEIALLRARNGLVQVWREDFALTGEVKSDRMGVKWGERS
jgi:hypothetical protein